MREHYQEKLHDVKDKIIGMGKEVLKRFEDSVRAIDEMDTDTAESIINTDQKVNEMQIYIEEQIIGLLAMEQPVASDLREVFAYLKIAASFERMGDYTVHIAKTVKKVSDRPVEKIIVNIKKMHTIASDMLSKILDEIKDGSGEGEEFIAMRDKEINAAHKEFISELYNNRDKIDIKEFIRLIMVGKHIERFGDHIKNICESIHYSKKAEFVDY